MKTEILYEVKAQHGSTLRCKGWKQETLLRMLENNMENAEAPEYLVIYGGKSGILHITPKVVDTFLRRLPKNGAWLQKVSIGK